MVFSSVAHLCGIRLAPLFLLNIPLQEVVFRGQTLFSAISATVTNWERY